MDEVSAAIEAKVPLHRFGEADEIACAVLFLASDDASYMTGAELLVDGELTSECFLTGRRGRGCAALLQLPTNKC